MISVENLVTGYGGLQVLKLVSLSVGAAELVTVIGANGAGKSTLLRCVQGLLPAWSGNLRFADTPINNLSSEKIVRLGLTLVTETRELFPDLSVIDNLALGAYIHRHERNAARRRRSSLEEVFEMFPVLRERRDARAAALSGGQQQMLAIGRAMMTRPKALMLDEPSLGLAPLVVKQIFAATEVLRQRGLAILLVEQNVRAALRLSSRTYVLETGAVVGSGRSAELINDPRVIKAYLGTRTHRPA